MHGNTVGVPGPKVKWKKAKPGRTKPKSPNGDEMIGRDHLRFQNAEGQAFRQQLSAL